MEPHACRDCGKSILADEPLYRVIVKITDEDCDNEESEAVQISMYFCETCHEALYTSDLLEATQKAIVAELRETRNTCITTRRAKENDDGD